jgi:hypothetical protein
MPKTRVAQNARPSPWAVSFLMFSILAAATALGLLGVDFGLI